MPTLNPNIEVVVLVDRHSGESSLRFESVLCSGDCAGELWWEIDTTYFVLYQQEEFYDSTLKNRRNSNNMLSPRDAHCRLAFVGAVWGIESYDKAKHIEISRSCISPVAG